MSEAAETLEGWYALHDFHTIDWVAWKGATAEERETAKHDLMMLICEWSAVESRMEGSLAMYAIVDQKAEIMFINLRETLKELNSAENAFNRSRFAKFVKPDC
ncbi:chlorite dismutase family protein [Paenibacillus sp. FSL L8-0506]|uniref:chlorite dismutase family protein n=1 Tax=Paenibacillus sp. FSL L8-0506 TaxID=2975335 RepID=UPI0030FC5E32